jgi:hypothetical protein
MVSPQLFLKNAIPTRVCVSKRKKKRLSHHLLLAFLACVCFFSNAAFFSLIPTSYQRFPSVLFRFDVAAVVFTQGRQRFVLTQGRVCGGPSVRHCYIFQLVLRFQNIPTEFIDSCKAKKSPIGEKRWQAQNKRESRRSQLFPWNHLAGRREERRSQEREREEDVKEAELRMSGRNLLGKPVRSSQ